MLTEVLRLYMADKLAGGVGRIFPLADLETEKIGPHAIFTLRAIPLRPPNRLKLYPTVPGT